MGHSNTRVARGDSHRRAISWMELAVVALVLAIVAALAAPQMSWAQSRNDAESLRVRLQVMRTAIARYYGDHHAFPAAVTRDAAANTNHAATFIAQLTQFTDLGGNVLPPGSTTSLFGPYLRDGIPSNPMCTHCSDGGAARVAMIAEGAPLQCRPTLDAGWIYDPRTGYLIANTPGVDERGIRFDSY